MSKSQSSVESTPNVNVTARLSLSWFANDGLGTDCYVNAEDGSRDYEPCQVWLPDFSSIMIDETFLTPGHHEISPVIFAAIRDYYKSVKEEKGTLRCTGAHVVDSQLGLLRYKLNDSKVFGGKTGLRLTVFAPKAS